MAAESGLAFFLKPHNISGCLLLSKLLQAESEEGSMIIDFSGMLSKQRPGLRLHTVVGMWLICVYSSHNYFFFLAIKRD